MKLGAHMIPCRTCLAEPTSACQFDSCYDDDGIDGFHETRVRDVAVLNDQLTKAEAEVVTPNRWSLALPSSPGGVCFVLDGESTALFGQRGEAVRRFMASTPADAERLAGLLEKSDRIRDRMTEAGYFSR